MSNRNNVNFDPHLDPSFDNDYDVMSSQQSLKFNDVPMYRSQSDAFKQLAQDDVSYATTTPPMTSLMNFNVDDLLVNGPSSAVEFTSSRFQGNHGNQSQPQTQPRNGKLSFLRVLSDQQRLEDDNDLVAAQSNDILGGQEKYHNYDILPRLSNIKRRVPVHVASNSPAPARGPLQAFNSLQQTTKNIVDEPEANAILGNNGINIAAVFQALNLDETDQRTLMSYVTMLNDDQQDVSDDV